MKPKTLWTITLLTFLLVGSILGAALGLENFIQFSIPVTTADASFNLQVIVGELHTKTCIELPLTGRLCGQEQNLDLSADTKKYIGNCDALFRGVFFNVGVPLFGSIGAIVVCVFSALFAMSVEGQHRCIQFILFFLNAGSWGSMGYVCYYLYFIVPSLPCDPSQVSALPNFTIYNISSLGTVVACVIQFIGTLFLACLLRSAPTRPDQLDVTTPLNNNTNNTLLTSQELQSNRAIPSVRSPPSNVQPPPSAAPPVGPGGLRREDEPLLAAPSGYYNSTIHQQPVVFGQPVYASP